MSTWKIVVALTGHLPSHARFQRARRGCRPAVDGRKRRSGREHGAFVRAPSLPPQPSKPHRSTSATWTRTSCMVFTSAGQFRAVSLFPGNYEIRVTAKDSNQPCRKLR